MVVHELKTWPYEFAAVRAGTKKYEIRKNDRNFKVGDGLLLNEWYPEGYCRPECNNKKADIPHIHPAGYTGEWERRGIAYITPGGSWGLPPDICVLGFE